MSPTQWASLRYFHREEFISPDTRTEDMNAQFLLNLDELRAMAGFAFHINSGWRSKAHNHALGGAAHSAHLEGLAVDIAVYGEQAFKLLDQISEFNSAQGVPYFTGIGIKQTGTPKSRFIHLDAAKAIEGVRPRPTVWSY